MNPHPTRCAWLNLQNPLCIAYHDEEWGVPVYDDQKLFEMLTLEGAQAGLSWETVLAKRSHYRRVFAEFDPIKVAAFDEQQVGQLLEDKGIIRNRLKVESTVSNARAFLELRQQQGSFARYLWKFVDGSPIQHRRATIGEVPASTPLSISISKDLKKRGFRFVGPTIIYAFMQAVGMVNDHTTDCFRHAECTAYAHRD